VTYYKSAYIIGDIPRIRIDSATDLNIHVDSSMPFNEVSAIPKQRKRPSFLDADPRFFVQSTVLPWAVLEPIRELVELRAELKQFEKDEKQGKRFVTFLEKEVQAMFDVTERSFYTPEEEAVVYKELRASARVVLGTLNIHETPMECMSWGVCVSRNEIYSRIHDKADMIARIHTPV